MSTTQSHASAGKAGSADGTLIEGYDAKTPNPSTDGECDADEYHSATSTERPSRKGTKTGKFEKQKGKEQVRRPVRMMTGDARLCKQMQNEIQQMKGEVDAFKQEIQDIKDGQSDLPDGPDPELVEQCENHLMFTWTPSGINTCVDHILSMGVIPDKDLVAKGPRPNAAGHRGNAFSIKSVIDWGVSWARKASQGLLLWVLTADHAEVSDLADSRADANSMQKAKHQMCLYWSKLELRIGNMVTDQGMYLVDYELLSQLLAPAITNVPLTDLGKSMTGAVRRYHLINNDRRVPLRFQQDPVQNTLMFAQLIAEEMRRSNSTVGFTE